MTSRSPAPNTGKPQKTKAAKPQALELPEDLRQDLRPGQSLALLQELHILTREGRLNQDSRRKLKQVRHLVQFIEPLLAQWPPQTALRLADHGAGKSYLGFILYDLCLRERALAEVWGIEQRPELVQRAQALATRLGFTRMHFVALSSQQASAPGTLPTQFDVVTALHACDTATDDAIAFALLKVARHIVLAPCCQAEVAALLRHNKAQALARTPLAELWRQPLHAREMGSQLTNVLRCLYLRAHGYNVRVTELVGWEHSLKNELILAQFDGQRQHSAWKRLVALCSEFGLSSLLGQRFIEPLWSGTGLHL